jgi:hypothetical protein
MSALLTRRAGRRAGRCAGAAALVLALSGGGMLVGAGSASAAAPTPVTCTLLGGPLNEPVAVKPGEQVQLVLVVPVLGTRVNVGPAQTVGNNPGEQLLQATVTNVLGLVGQVCQAAVNVQSTVSSVVPVPPVTVPTLPRNGPSQSVTVPLPGANVGIEQGGQPGAPPPPGGNPEPGAPTPSPPSSGTDPRTNPFAPSGPISWRFDNARIPLYDFSSVPYGVGYRFGGISAPAFRYGQRVPGYAPQFGILGADPGDDVATVGTVEALPVGGAKVALPVLLAVLLLSAVTGTLVRTWVLRRA